MRNLRRRLLLTTLLAAAALTPVSAQTLVLPSPIAPALDWSPDAFDALLRVIDASAAEGLEPEDYSAAALHRARAAGQIPAGLATASALRLAHDYTSGHVPEAGRVDWHMGATINDAALRQLLAGALAEGRVEALFERLLPPHEAYRALKRALAETPPSDRPRAERLRVNLERWRWMPRDLGPRYILANVPAYKVQLIDNGLVVAEHEAIFGKLRSPTPAFAATATDIVLNPGWYVPRGLKAQKLRFYRRSPTRAKRLGYSVSYSEGGVTIHQRPGPANPLGQMKLVMPNRWDVYLHDTNQKVLFAQDERARSAGCIRVDRALELARMLLDGGDWDGARLDDALAGRRTVTAELPQPVPIYVTYLTAEVDAAGQVRLLPDPYHRDVGVARALDGATPMASTAE